KGIAKVAQKYLEQDKKYQGILSKKDIKQVTSRDIFEAYKTQDPIAVRTLNNLVELCGMTVANLVSLFNPEKIIMGGGVFGPATSLIPEIKKEALKWAQPISIHQVSLEVSILGGDAGLYGAGKLALLPDDMN
ncbi:MAG: ROK family protein, partial [Candidatus Delongbacteria bacterium]|nr:ROK family protein [Candidatus Delongbacteria bacterium]